MTALAAPVKDRGGLVSRADLNFHEKCALTAAHSRVGTLNGCRVGVLEGLCATQHVVHFLSLQMHLVFKLGLNAIDVWTGATEEAAVVCGLLCEQNVRTGGAEKH